MPATGLLLMVGGLNDIRGVPGGWDRGFRRAGLPHDRDIYRWQLGGWASVTLADLWDTAHHRAAAEKLSAKIAARRKSHPGGPIHVIAHSAGTAVTALALERLPPANGVTSVAFVGSALSPGYDLGPTLDRCDYGLLSVESVLDCIHLGLGTRVFGTADRVYGRAAGMAGFAPPSRNADKLHTLRWQPKLIGQGWIGEHLTQGSPGFARRTLAPWVRRAEGYGEPGA